MLSEYLTFAKVGLNSSVKPEECLTIATVFGNEMAPIKYKEYDQTYGALRSDGYKKTELFEAFKQLSEKKCVFSKVIKIKFDQKCVWPKKRYIHNPNGKKNIVVEECLLKPTKLKDQERIQIDEY
jgi:hypothetical protein